MTLPANHGKTICEDVPVKPMQFMGHVAIDEQQSAMAFSAGTFLCGQQSISSIDEDTWFMEEDMPGVSAAFTTAPPLTGSMATERAIKMARTVRPSCMGSALLADNSRFPTSMVKGRFCEDYRTKNIRPILVQPDGSVHRDGGIMCATGEQGV